MDATTSTEAVAPGSRAATLAACAYAAVVVGVLGVFLFDIPIQLTDCFGNMLHLDVSWRQLMYSEFTQRAYLRPMLWADFKAVYDLSGGNYFWWFRGVHVAQVAVLVALVLRVLRPRTWLDAAIVPFGLAVLIGIHTFDDTIREAFPINTFLTILICCLAATIVSLARYRWWHDLFAVLLLAYAALTVESGLLVWVVFIGAALVGARGLSRWGVSALVLELAGYFVLRFRILHVGGPGLIERASGYGFQTLEPSQLIAMFGTHPLGFYLYNVVTSFASVLFSEPRAGVFRLVRSLVEHQPDPAMIVNVVASVLATAVIALYAWRRRREWMGRAFTDDDRIVLLFVMVLCANAVLSYPYTKDVVMSPAGMYYALAAFIGVRDMLRRLPVRAPAARYAGPALCCAMLAITWGVRDVGEHMTLRQQALRVRQNWAYADYWFDGQHDEDLSEPHARALKQQLQDEATIAHPTPVYFWLMDSRFLDVH